MQANIDKLRSHTIVCGFGRIGRTVTHELSEAGEPFVLIECDDDRFEAAREAGHPIVKGSASEDEVLARAGIAVASNLVAAVDSEMENIVITLTAREIRRDLTIVARAEREEEIRKLRRAGASRIVAPFRSGGVEIANAILRPQVAEFLDRSARCGSGLAFGEIVVEEGSELDGLALADYGRGQGARISFVGLQRPGEDIRVPPSGSECLRGKDVLIVAGDAASVGDMYERARLAR